MTLDRRLEFHAVVALVVGLLACAVIVRWCK